MLQAKRSATAVLRVCSLLLLLFALPPALADEAAEEREDATIEGTAEDAADEAPQPSEEVEEGTVMDADERERLREEIRSELLEEMRAELDAQREEIRAELRESMAEAAPWEPERWEMQPPPRPAFFELDGYFRARGDVFVNLDMNAGVDPRGQPLFITPAAEDSDTLSSANQRLRLDPTFNISEDLSVHATVDVLDNLVWGQTPDSFPRDGNANDSSFLSETQVPPMAGINAARDSLRVKRAWGEVLTPVGLLSFGRMGSHWGLGMLMNDGDDIDADFGTTVDRLMFVTLIGDHFVVPAFDIMSSGPIYQPRDEYQGQAFDLENRDDVLQYVLAIARRDSDEEVRRQVLDGRTVINYGLYNVLRRQTLDFIGSPPAGRDYDDRWHRDSGLEADDFIRRNAYVYIPDVWFRLTTARLRLEVEAAAVLGRIDNALPTSPPDAVEDAAVSITQFGAVAQADYSFLRDRLRVGLETGFASGDRAPGMGVRATGEGLSEPGSIDGRQFNVDPDVGEIDNTLNNFRFNRAYNIDEILWRRVLGRVTDAIYLRPTLSYDLAESFGFDLAAIYSRAVFEESTPGDSPELGLELNGGLRYLTRDGFFIKGVYGILFPFGGLELEGDRPEIAQIIRGVAAITF